VHKNGGSIFLQLWHIGRAAHSSNIGKPTVSSSNIPIKGNTRDSQGNQVPYEAPTPLTVPQIKELVRVYKTAAGNAIKAGFDGVEVSYSFYMNKLNKTLKIN
jgi:2,4-dienoyl-CoA reductase-like NADH-dependent reductase (Old Yellow Enzyme family)